MKGRDNKTVERHLQNFYYNETDLYIRLLDSKAAYQFNQIVLAALHSDMLNNLTYSAIDEMIKGVDVKYQIVYHRLNDPILPDRFTIWISFYKSLQNSGLTNEWDIKFDDYTTDFKHHSYIYTTNFIKAKCWDESLENANNFKVSELQLFQRTFLDYHKFAMVDRSELSNKIATLINTKLKLGQP